jgi:hypothetical protein
VGRPGLWFFIVFIVKITRLWRERGDRRSDHVYDEAEWSVDGMETIAAFLGTR